MKKEIKYTDKGYSYIECTIEDCFRWGGFGICDSCGNDMKLDKKIYLVWVLHSALCEKCFEEWCKRSKRYEEDLYLQKDSDKAYYRAYGFEV